MIGLAKIITCLTPLLANLHWLVARRVSSFLMSDDSESEERLALSLLLPLFAPKKINAMNCLYEKYLVGDHTFQFLFVSSVAPSVLIEFRLGYNAFDMSKCTRRLAICECSASQHVPSPQVYVCLLL